MRVNGVDVKCPKCGQGCIIYYGKYKGKIQNYRCQDCYRQFRVSVKAKKDNSEKMKKAVSLYYYGFSVRLIAKELKCNESNIVRWVKKFATENKDFETTVSMLMQKKDVEKRISEILRYCVREININSEILEDEEIDEEGANISKEEIETLKQMMKRTIIAKKNFEGGTRQGKLLDGIIWVD